MFVPETTRGTWVVSSAVDAKEVTGLEVEMKGVVKPEMTGASPRKLKIARRMVTIGESVLLVDLTCREIPLEMSVFV